MGSTTAKGVPYPVSTDTPDVPRDVKAVADWLTAAVPWAVAAGQVTVAGTGVVSGGNVQVAMTFPVSRFSQVPRCAVSLANAPSQTSNLTARLVPSSASAGTMWVLNVGTTTVTWTGLLVDWQAMQATSAAASG